MFPSSRRADSGRRLLNVTENFVARTGLNGASIAKATLSSSGFYLPSIISASRGRTRTRHDAKVMCKSFKPCIEAKTLHASSHRKGMSGIPQCSLAQIRGMPFGGFQASINGEKLVLKLILLIC